MTQFIDAKYATLISVTGGNGSINDEELAFVRSIGATSTNLRDAWFQYLALQGFTVGSFNDRAYSWLGSLGHVGTLNERWFAYWAAGVVVIPAEYTTEYTTEYR